MLPRSSWLAIAALLVGPGPRGDRPTTQAGRSTRSTPRASSREPVLRRRRRRQARRRVGRDLVQGARVDALPRPQGVEDRDVPQLLLDHADGRQRRRQDGLHHLLVLRAERRLGREPRRRRQGVDLPRDRQARQQRGRRPGRPRRRRQARRLPNSVNTIAWYSLAPAASQPVWKKHDFGTAAAGHGVGSGDINGDGRTDLLTPKGWFEAPSDPKTAATWTWHPDWNLGATGIQILAKDVDGDGKVDLVLRDGARPRVVLGQARHRSRWEDDLDQAADRPEPVVGPRPELGRPRWRRPGQRTPQRQAGLCPRDRGRGRRSVADRLLHVQARAPRSRPWQKHLIFQGEHANAETPKEGGKRDAQKDFPAGTAGTGLEVPVVDMDGDGDLDLVCPGKSGLYWFENPLKAATSDRSDGGHPRYGRQSG